MPTRYRTTVEEEDVSIGEFDDDTLLAEFRRRHPLGCARSVAEMALDELRRGNSEEAALILERHLHPKWPDYVRDEQKADALAAARAQGTSP